MKIVAVVLVALFLNLSYPSPALAGSSPEKEARFAEKVQTEIAKLGTGQNARVDLKVRDKTKLKGYISEVGAESFVVIDDKTGSATTITYPQVKQVRGNNLATGWKIAIGVGIFIGVMLILAPHVAQ